MPEEKVKSFKEIDYPEFLFDENMNLKSGAQELDNYIKFRENSENRTKNSAANPPATIGSQNFIGGADSELFRDQNLAQDSAILLREQNQPRKSSEPVENHSPNPPSNPH